MKEEKKENDTKDPEWSQEGSINSFLKYIKGAARDKAKSVPPGSPIFEPRPVSGSPWFPFF